MATVTVSRRAKEGYTRIGQALIVMNFKTLSQKSQKPESDKKKMCSATHGGALNLIFPI